jgi:hypothetical protein
MQSLVFFAPSLSLSVLFIGGWGSVCVVLDTDGESFLALDARFGVMTTTFFYIRGA